MSIEFGLPEEAAGPMESEEPECVRALVQRYRCPAGHVSDIVWTAPEILLACEANEVRFWCQRCLTARFASEPEASSLLAAFGLAPGLRIYSS